MMHHTPFRLRATIFAALGLATALGTTARAAVLVDNYSIPANAGGLSSNGLLGPVMRTDALPSPVPYLMPTRDANVTANPGGLVTATIGSGFLVNASSSLTGGALTLTYYGGPPVNLYANGGSQLDLDFFSVFPVIPNSMSVVATVNGVVNSAPQILPLNGAPQTVSIPFASFSLPGALTAASTLKLTFNFASAGFFTLDSVAIPTTAVPEASTGCMWLLVGCCGIGLTKLAPKNWASQLRG